MVSRAAKLLLFAALLGPMQPVFGQPAGPPTTVNPVTGQTSVSAVNYRPLTGRQRWKLYWKQNYASTGAYFGPVFTALAIDQPSNSPSEWGGGAAGLGRRLGSRLATGIVQGTLQSSLAPLLDEDVRYISAQPKGFKHRAVHAIVYSFMTYNSQGHTVLNVANLSSYYAAAAISTTWVPVHGSQGKYALTNGSEQLGLSIPVNMIQEFWPEIRHYVFRQK